jgi:hypothetical protein
MIQRKAALQFDHEQEQGLVTLRPKHMDVQAAARDLRLRTLSQIPRVLDQLIYLASLRDYNTGVYYHDGLGSRFSEEAACEALADCHREAFRQMLSCSLEEIVNELQAYMQTTSSGPVEFLAAWKGLKPYRVAVPAETDPLAAEFLFSNLKVALAILESRLRTSPAPGQAAWQPPQPVQ